MPLAAALAAATLAATSLPTTQSADPAATFGVSTSPWTSVHSACGRQFDPQFVRFVPPAPSSGRNPLLRLIAGRDAAVPLHDTPDSCKRMLTRYDGAP